MDALTLRQPPQFGATFRLAYLQQHAEYFLRVGDRDLFARAVAKVGFIDRAIAVSEAVYAAEIAERRTA